MITWIKENKGASIIIFIALIIGLIFILSSSAARNRYGVGGSAAMSPTRAYAPSQGLAQDSSASMMESSYTPSAKMSQTPGGSARMVIQESMLSLVVGDVKKTGSQIIDYAKSAGGYMVSSQYSNPNESPFASITIRVPSDQFDAALVHFRSLASKISSENLIGTDVTDQYHDLDASLATLQKTKSKFEEFMNSAHTIDDILNVQNRIIQLQSSIDSIKGQQKALVDEANMTKITVYLSSDELSLPYAPDQSASRPSVVFKLAVRSLVQTLRSIGGLLIWLGVYAIIWAPILLLFVAYIQWTKRRAQKKTLGL